jgi:hypothetical protein
MPPLPLGEGWGEGRSEKFSLWRSQVYFDHRENIDRMIEESEASVSAWRKESPSLLAMKMNARRDG